MSFKKKKKKGGEREREKIQFGIVCFLAWFGLVLICLGSQGHYLFENIHNLRVMENYKCSAKKNDFEALHWHMTSDVTRFLAYAVNKNISLRWIICLRDY